MSFHLVLFICATFQLFLGIHANMKADLIFSLNPTTIDERQPFRLKCEMENVVFDMKPFEIWFFMDDDHHFYEYKIGGKRVGQVGSR